MPRVIAIRCECCQLHANVPDTDGCTKATMCGPCIEHRGVNAEMELRRHQEHERMLRVQLTAASEWAKRAETERDDAFRRMKRAFSSRDHAVGYLQRILDIHDVKIDGSCKCGKRTGCTVGTILAEKWARQMIGRKDRADDEEYGGW